MKNIEQEVDLNGYTGFVLFSAPWCKPCVTYKPLLEDFAGVVGAEVVGVNVEAFRGLAGALSIRSVPSTFWFHNGKPVNQAHGVQTTAALRRLLPHGL